VWRSVISSEQAMRIQSGGGRGARSGFAQSPEAVDHVRLAKYPPAFGKGDECLTHKRN
jgi:hypothetical protein